MVFVRLLLISLLCFPHLSAARDPITHVIIFGGVDQKDDWTNQMYSDFVVRAKAFQGPGTKLYVYFGFKEDSGFFKSSTWSRSSMEKAIGLQKGSVQPASAANIGKILTEILFQVQEGDQVLLMFETHGTKFDHKWSITDHSDKENILGADSIIPFLSMIRQKKAKIAVYDGSCFGGASIEKLSKYACVIAESDQNLSSCSKNYLELFEHLGSQSRRTISIEEVFLKMSDSKWAKNQSCISQPVISGFPDITDVWRNWLEKLADEGTNPVKTDFYKDFEKANPYCDSLNVKKSADQWMQSLLEHAGATRSFKKEYIDRMKGYLDIQSRLRQIQNEGQTLRKQLESEILNQKPFLFEKTYQGLDIHFGDWNSNEILTAYFKFFQFLTDYERVEKKGPYSQVAPSFTMKKEGQNQARQYTFRLMINPNASLLLKTSKKNSNDLVDLAILNLTRLSPQFEKSIKHYTGSYIRLSLLYLFDDITKEFNQRMTNQIKLLRDKIVKNMQDEDEFLKGHAPYLQQAKAAAKDILEEDEEKFRKALFDVQRSEYSLTMKDLDWKEKNKKLTYREKLRLEQIRRCQEFKLEMGR